MTDSNSAEYVTLKTNLKTFITYLKGLSGLQKKHTMKLYLLNSRMI